MFACRRALAVVALRPARSAVCGLGSPARRGFIRPSRNNRPCHTPRSCLSRDDDGMRYAQDYPVAVPGGVEDDNPPDWKVRTTFVPALQKEAERAVSQGLAKFRQTGLQAALVAIDPQTGDVLALVGGRDFQRTPFNRATNAKRQPGSAFKPFVFAAALNNGMSPISPISDLNNLRVPGYDEWEVTNVSAGPETVDAPRSVVRAEQSGSRDRRRRSAARPCGHSPIRRVCQMTDVAPSLAIASARRRVGATTTIKCSDGDLRSCAPIVQGSTPTATRSDRAAAKAVCPPRAVVSNGVDACRRRRHGDRRCRSISRRALPGWRKDGHHGQLQRCVVRRLLIVDGRRRLGGIRSAGEDCPGRLRRTIRVADLGRFHVANRTRAQAGRPFAYPPTVEAGRLCA